MDAFQRDAFQNNAFQMDEETAVEQHGSHRRNRPDYGGYQKQIEREIERHEMKLSEELAKKLEETIADNNAMMRINNNLLQANSNLLSVVQEIKQKAVIVQEKPRMDDAKKAELLLRLAQGKEKKRLEEEARKKEMQKRMANVRKGKGK